MTARAAVFCDRRAERSEDDADARRIGKDFESALWAFLRKMAHGTKYSVLAFGAMGRNILKHGFDGLWFNGVRHEYSAPDVVFSLLEVGLGTFVNHNIIPANQFLDFIDA